MLTKARVDDFEDATRARWLAEVGGPPDAPDPARDETTHASPSSAESADAAVPLDQAQRFEEARRRYQRQLNCSWDGEWDYGCLRTEFLRAYRTMKSYKLLYNLALVDEQLGEYPAAHGFLEAYLEFGGGAVSSERRAEVLKELAQIAPRTAWIAIECKGSGIRVESDDIGVAECPLKKRWRASVGRQQVVVASRSAGGDRTEHRLTLVAAALVSLVVGP